MIDFNVLFNASPNCYMVLAPDFTIVEANDAWFRVTARQRDDTIGKNLFLAFPDPDENNRQELFASLQRVLDKRSADNLALIRYAIPRRTDKGTVFDERYWSATNIPIFDEHGKVAYILQHTVDVTELQCLKKAVQAAQHMQAPVPQESMESAVFRHAREVQVINKSLDAETQHLRRLFEQAPGFMCYLRGPNLVFEMANKAYMQVVGHRFLLGKSLREALPELEGQGYFELLDDVFQSGRPFVGQEMKVMLQRQPGAALEECYMDLVYQPVIEADGSVSGIFVQGHDITRQKHTQDELKKYRESLESQVAERTRQLSELAGYLQKVSEAEKNRLSRELHDELGALLTAIMIDVHWSKNNLRNDTAAVDMKLSRALEHLEQGIALKRRIIEDLRPSIIFHLGLSEALYILAEEVAERNGWAVDFDLPDDLPPIQEDIAVALYRIAQESLTNASKYAHAEKIGITLYATPDWIELEVWDNGRGFDLEQHRRTALGHHGLIGMEQRTLAFSGSLEVDTEPGRGVRIAARIPNYGLHESREQSLL